MFRTFYPSFHISNDAKTTENYKQIKANIEFASFKDHLNVFSIISASSGEGKTTTACHLALSFANEGKKVLLIDGNLKKPSLHRYFETENDYGLSNILIGHKNLFNSIKLTAYDGLSLLTAGASIAHSSLAGHSSAMDKIMEEVKKKYDYIFIDNSAVLDSETGKLFSKKSDGTILVVRDHRTVSDSLVEAKVVLEAYGVNIMGVVFNYKKKSILKKMR